jgi:glutaredoxin
VVAIFILFLIVLLFSSRNTGQHGAKASSGKHVDNLLSIIDSNNDDKVDAAINNEISKANGQMDDLLQDGNPDKNLEIPNDNLLKDEKGAEPDVEFDPVDELIQIRSLGPMTVFSKSTCPFSRRIKQLLKENYQITPEPQIVELDKHKHGRELQDYLKEVTGRGTVPNVIIGSSMESKGGFDDFAELHKNGELLDALKDWGKNLIDVKKINAPSNF